MVGNCVSFIVTVKLQVAWLDEASVIFQVTVLTPLLKNTPFNELATILEAVVAPLKEYDLKAPEQLSPDDVGSNSPVAEP